MTARQIPVFFIVGRERSGTTLLQVLLDNHPNIIAPTESPFIRHLYRKHAKRKRWDEKNILEFYNDLLDEPYLQLWNIDKKELEHDLLALKENASFADLCKTVYLHSLSAKGKNDIRLIGDKNPQYSLFIPELLAVFPQAKFIFITRDPRDQVLSMLKVNFEKKLIASLAYRWKHFNQKIEAQRKKYPSQFYELKYEDLVSDPVKKLKEITAFLGVDYTDAMLDTAKRAEFYVNTGSLVKQHHQSLLQPIDPGKVNRWKQEMKEADVRIIDSIAGDLAKAKGYEVKHKNSSLLTLFRALPGITYGRLYFTFLGMMNALPYSWRMLLFRKLIAKQFGFWKENEKQRAV